VLKHEGLVRRMEDQPRYCECLGPGGFKGTGKANGREKKPAANGSRKPAAKPIATAPAETKLPASKLPASKLPVTKAPVAEPAAKKRPSRP
jgi:hypothetical protein